MLIVSQANAKGHKPSQWVNKLNTLMTDKKSWKIELYYSSKITTNHRGQEEASNKQ